MQHNRKVRFFIFTTLVLVVLLTLLLTVFYIPNSKNAYDLSSSTSQSITNARLAARLSNLQRGVDITHWFRFPLDESDDYFNNYITDDDLHFIEQSGFTHIRLAIAPEYIFDASSPTKINDHMLPFIDQAISRILSHHLAVVVDIHDEQKTFENDANARNFIVFWANFAKHLTQFDANSVFLELLNEPVFTGKENTWLLLQKKLIAAVRKQAPDNTIIATGANWGSIEGLQNVKPYQDNNIIYSFHYYEPMAFTHQGANWIGDSYPSIANLEYPYNAANCEQVLSKITTNNAMKTVQEYCDKKWNKNEIANYIQQAVNWSKAHKVPIWVGEFGAYCKQTPRRSKLQWIEDVKDIFEQNHIGWTLWGYDDCFGLGATKINGVITYDNEVLQILGIVSGTQYGVQKMG